jgi:hypothetical protein
MAEFAPMVAAAVAGGFVLGSLISLWNSWGV